MGACLLLALTLAASCTTSPAVIASDVDAPQCGLRGALGDMSNRPESGTPVSACALPSKDQIGSACASRDAVPIPGSENPDHPGEPNHRFPDYRVQDAQCAFLDEGRSRAACSFHLLAGGAAPERMEAEFIYRFHDLSNDIAHGWYSTRWGVDAVCRSR